ncbi:MAG: cyclodeaminase/cyclohydrolase family protein [Planctomycetota bacterium]|nr:cyclodeaminase/cyclohydrolase family protein [Planctomycetota bacterium]
MDYRQEPLMRYLNDAAAAQPTPGGGSVAAMAAALASTMASMAAGFTAGKEKFKAVEAEIQAALARLAALRGDLLEMVHEDMDAYEAIMAAYRLPKATDAEKAARAEAVRKATKSSLGLVMRVLDASRDVAAASRCLAEIANPNLLSDVAVAAELALGAARSARVNVAVNLSGYSDKADADAVRAAADKVVAETERLAAETRERVMGHLSK